MCRFYYKMAQKWECRWKNCEADVEVPREVMLACYDGSQSRPAKHQVCTVLAASPSPPLYSQYR